MKRRKFVTSGAAVSLGFIGLQAFAGSCKNTIKKTDPDLQLSDGYGPLIEDPSGKINLPSGFIYKIISSEGQQMSDGLIVPGLADGMAAFQGENDKIILIRNHELSPGDNSHSAFGSNLELLDKISSDNFYDYGSGKLPCIGGTTTLVYDPKTQEIEKSFLSLTGTIRNCAGGTTPWNSWITCEESVRLADDKLEKNHGYNFEVPASTEIQLAPPNPIKAMGRFNHEAVCVDPRTSIVYQTEDRPDSLIYRFLPNVKERLNAGGQLQILAFRDRAIQDTRNWKRSGQIEINKEYEVDWINIQSVDSVHDDLRFRGEEMGAAVFARGEGMWFGDNELYFACTNGGRKKHGQVFRYQPSDKEGQADEEKYPGKLTLFAEPNNTDLLKSCDNVTIASNGHLVLCEDRFTPRIVGVTPQGQLYHIAKNVGYRSEFAGACFSPDGSTLFVNIQLPGLTLAIIGPWNSIS